MRIVAGAFGGQRLISPPGNTTRPTADRVREALFSSLGPLDGMVVLDLFAGTGALGLEALSRGARRAVFVERERRALTALAANVASLAPSPGACTIHARDVASVLQDASAHAEAYDLAFVDPPYRLAAEIGDGLGPALLALLAPGGRVVTESDRRSPMDLSPELPLSRERRYGDTLIRIHTA